MKPRRTAIDFSASPPIWTPAWFEHRRVCYDTYHALYGGYFSRVRGFLSFLWHFMRHSGRVRRHMQKQDECAGRVDRSAEARARGRRLFWRQMRFVLPRLLGVLMPWDSAARIADLRSVDHCLTAWEG